jgi:hypothetical protein
MTKKKGKGKDTFRHTKKKILHKKGVNTKKRGLRGGMFKMLSQLVTTSSPVANPRSHIDRDGTLHGIRDKFTLSKLSDAACLDYMYEINNYEKDGNHIQLVTGSGGIRDYNECLRILNRVVTFDTSLRTGMSATRDPKTLTLIGCKAIKKGIIGTSNQFKYEIFSPAATTEPPNGGSQGETLVGTFTQLPVSVLLKMAGQERSFQNFSFYNENEERKSYFTDYISCLENVKQNFGPQKETTSSQITTFRPANSSILRQFGKDAQCKIVLLAGNIGTEIQKSDNNGSVFVGASQLNGAEYPTPEPVTDLNKYKEDPTGGPLLQLTCHPAVSKFIMLHAARKLPTGTIFTSEFLVINAVDGVISGISPIENQQMKAGLSLNNGYLEVKGNNSGNFTSVDFEFYTADYSSELNQKKLSVMATKIFDSFCTNLKVLQTDDVPTSGLRPPPKNRRDAEGYKEFNSSATSKVSLIYSSAVPLNYVYRLPSGEKTAINPEKSTLQYCVAGFDLVAQYFGAMVSAYNKSKKPVQVPSKKVKLFLTPLGGGVFQNPREMIACSALLAYYQAQQLFTDFDDKVEVIFLVWDGSEDECFDFSEFFNEDGTQSVTEAIRKLQQKKEEERQREEKLRSEDQGDILAASGASETSVTAGIASDKTGADTGAAAPASLIQGDDDRSIRDFLGGGSKSRRRHRHKPARKTTRKSKSKSKSKSKPKSKTHRRRRAHHSRTRKHKKYTRKH